MLGRTLRDPEHVESDETEAAGLGLLPVETVFVASKHTSQVRARVVAPTGPLGEAYGEAISGYEIHNGLTTGELPGAFQVTERSGRPADHPDGAVNATGNVLGTYIHGLFDEPGFRGAFLTALARRKGLTGLPLSEHRSLEASYDRWASHVRAALDMGRIYQITGLERSGG